jgi:hypothetical protein
MKSSIRAAQAAENAGDGFTGCLGSAVAAAGCRLQRRWLRPARRLADAVLAEAHEEWQVVGKHYLSERSMALPPRHSRPGSEGGSAARTAHGPSQKPIPLARTR